MPEAPDRLPSEPPSIGSALAHGTATLNTVSDTPRRDASLLLARCAGLDQAALIAHSDRPLDPIQHSRFTAAIARAAHGEPIAYLLGSQPFWTLDLEVNGHTLIPRPDTETLVEQALKRLPTESPTRVLDLGTGSGAVAIAIASERPHCCVTATDISADALAVARRNATRAGVTIDFLESDWFSNLPNTEIHTNGATPFELIVSNPPYIAEGDPHLDAPALRHEPQRALVSGPDGLDAVRILIAQASGWLAPAGWLLLEHGYDQAEAVAGLMATHHYRGIETTHDLGGNPRVTSGQIPGTSA